MSAASLSDQSEDRGPELRGVRAVVPGVVEIDEPGEVARDAADVAGARRRVGLELSREGVALQREGGVAVDPVPAATTGAPCLVVDRQQDRLAEVGSEIRGGAAVGRGLAG